MARLPIDEAAERVANFLTAMTLEIQMLARACGKANVHDLEPEDLRALTLEASLITGIPLVGMHAAPHIRSRTRRPSRCVAASPSFRRTASLRRCRFCWPARSAVRATCTSSATAARSRSGRRPVRRPRSWADYLYARTNIDGVERAWWFHRAGCRRWFQAERDTRDNRVLQTAWTLPAAAATPVRVARADGDRHAARVGRRGRSRERRRWLRSPGRRVGACPRRTAAGAATVRFTFGGRRHDGAKATRSPPRWRPTASTS